MTKLIMYTDYGQIKAEDLSIVWFSVLLSQNQTLFKYDQESHKAGANQSRLIILTSSQLYKKNVLKNLRVHCTH